METTKRAQEIDQATRQESTNKSQNTQTAAGTATKTARETEEIKDVVEGTKQKLIQAYDRTASTLNDTYEKAVKYGKENPGKTTLIAFGVGVGVGLLVANGMSPRSRTRSIVPPVMNALSEIAVRLFR